jgi:hypothetical protein
MLSIRCWLIKLSSCDVPRHFHIAVDDGMAMASSSVHGRFGMGNLPVLNSECEGVRTQVEGIGLVGSTSRALRPASEHLA